MYYSSSCSDPFQYTSQTNANTHQNPILKQQGPSSSSPLLDFRPFAPFLDDDDFLLGDFFLAQHNHHQQEQQQILVPNNDSHLIAETNNQKDDQMNPAATSKKGTTRNNNKKKRNITNSPSSKQRPIPQRTGGKKDRHSKIYTAQGPRDRRMRLSLQIARKFFDLQDMLGFDKASKTIDWLFTKSKAAIKELADSLLKVKRRSDNDGGSRTVCSTSESEVMSDVKLTSDNNGDKRGMGTENDSFLRHKRLKKSAANQPVFDLLARESRDKARARARERTKEKLKNKGLDLDDKSEPGFSQSNPNNLEQLGHSSSLEDGEKQETKSLVKMVRGQEEDQEASTHFQLPHQMGSSICTVDKFLGLTSAAKSSSIFDLCQNFETPSGPDFEDHEISGLHGDWDIIGYGKALHNNRCYSMPNMKPSTTGNAHVQNPNAQIFMEASNFQEQQNLTSALMATSDTQEEYTSSIFINFEQNPSPIPMIPIPIDTGLHVHFTEDQFSCNPIHTVNKYGSLY